MTSNEPTQAIRLPIFPDKDPGEPQRMFALSLTAATDNPALIVLREKGYTLRVSCSRRRDGSTSCSYVAVADGRRFAATTGAELLGLVSLWEHFGENWNRQEPDIMDEVTENEEEDEEGVFRPSSE